MNTTKGFIVPLLLIIIAILLTGGGATYVFTQTKQGSPPPSATENAVSSQVTPTEGIPYIGSVTPAASPVGTVIEIRGSGFGNSTENVYFFFERSDGTVVSLPSVVSTQTNGDARGAQVARIALNEPVTPGLYEISTSPLGRKSNAIQFTVTEKDGSSQTDMLGSPTPISGDTTNWKTYRNDLYHFGFRYPNGWDVTKTSSALLADRFLLESKEGELVTISARQGFSKIMLSNRNGDILSYDKLQDSWMPEVGSQVIQNSQLKNHFITLPAAIYGATWDIYSYNAQNRQLTSEDGTQVHPAYFTTSGYPVYEFDRPNGDTTTFYFITPLPNGNAVYMYYFGGSLLPGLGKVVETISVL